MTLPEFFDDLLRRAEAMREQVPATTIYEPKAHGRRNQLQLEYLLSHLKVLANESRRPPSERTRSVVRGSWNYVSDVGKVFGLFEAYAGQEELKRELLEFVDGKQGT